MSLEQTARVHLSLACRELRNAARIFEKLAIDLARWAEDERLPAYERSEHASSCVVASTVHGALRACSDSLDSAVPGEPVEGITPYQLAAVSAAQQIVLGLGHRFAREHEEARRLITNANNHVNHASIALDASEVF